MDNSFIIILILNLVIHSNFVSSVTEEDEGVKYANRCEGMVLL